MDISDLPAFERDDLVELIEPVEVVGDEEHRASGRRGQHVGEQSAAGPGIEMGRGFVEYQQIRIGEQGPGYGQPLPLAAG